MIENTFDWLCTFVKSSTYSNILGITMLYLFYKVDIEDVIEYWNDPTFWETKLNKNKK